MKVVQKMPSIHIPIQKPDGSMEWVWYMFLQWLSEHLEDTDLSDYFTKEEINEMLTDYALDDGVVHKAGTETITGDKNFTGTNDFYKVNFSTAPTTAVPSSWGAVIKAKASFITSNYDVPGEGQYWQMQGVDVMANDNSYLSWSSTSRFSDGSTNYSICVRARADAESPNKDASMGIRVWPDGTSLTFAPNPVYSSNNTAIATTYWVRNLITTSTDLVHRTGDETINGIKTFNAEIKGRLRSASCHTGPDNTNCWYKLGEFKSRGGYNTHLVLFRAWVGINGTQQDGLVCGRIVTRTGSSGAGSEGRLVEGRIVFDTKPAWLDLNNFVILYKNDQTDDTGDYVQIEFWARTYSAHCGYTFSIFDERTGGEVYNPLWTFYNLPSGVADLPTGYTGQATSQTPNNTNTNVVHTSGNETIDGYKTFTAPTTTPYIYLGPQSSGSSSIEGGEINFKGGAAEPNASKNVIIDRYNGMIRIFGTDSNDVTKTVLQANIETGTLKGVVPTEDTTSSVQLDTVGARNTKLQNYQPLLTAGTGINIDANNVISSTASGYHPDLFDTKWSDHIVNDIQWLRGDTFSWQNGTVYRAAYDHLVDDIDGKTLQSETVGGVTVQFYLADDGHKICPATEETNVSDIYTATGVAWYYVLDTGNTRFKLPRAKHNKYADNLSVVGDGTQLHVRNNGDGNVYAITTSDRQYSVGDLKTAPLATPTDGSTLGMGSNTSVGLALSGSGVIAQQTQDTDQYKYLYFYVGTFSNSALENTAGLNASLFSGKADTNLLNTDANVDFVVESQEPTAENDYTWYRKYKSGWVEQGGTFATVNSNYHTESVVLPVPMNDENYTLNITSSAYGNVYTPVISVKTSTGFTTPNVTNVQAYSAGWQVSGKAA